MPRNRIRTTTLRLARWGACLFAVAALAGCALWPSSDDSTQAVAATNAQPIPDDIDTVLPQDSVLTAHTAAGHIKIEAGPGSLRIFSWEDARRAVATIPRDEPFVGAMSPGLHYAGQPPAWQPYQGIKRVHYEESSRNFASPMGAKIWTQIRRLYFTYNDQGLAIGWKRDGDTLHVEVWQFYVDGERPDNLPGANNDAIHLNTQASS